MAKILLLPDKFKTSLSSREVIVALQAGLQESLRKVAITSRIVSDGGEGFLEAIEQADPLDYHPIKVPGPLGEPVMAAIGLSRDRQRAYIESSQATGLHLIQRKQRNPLLTSSTGVADLLEHAIALQPQDIYIGLGSSGTSDGGMPVAARFGYCFRDDQGQLLEGKAEDLIKISKITFERFQPPKPIAFYGIADVLNPPVGPNGGVQWFAPQKGASGHVVRQLEASLIHYLACIQPWFSENLARLPCGGAAGALATGLFVSLGAKLNPGAVFMFKKLALQKWIDETDIVITGEGSFDQQSLNGKIPGEIVRYAVQRNKIVFVVTGRRTEIDYPGVTGFFSVSEICKNAGMVAPERTSEALKEIGRVIGHTLKHI